MIRALRLVGLVAALLWTQWVLAVHGAAHLADIDHDDEPVCELCLALASALPAPPVSPGGMLPVLKPSLLPSNAVSPRLTFSQPTYFLTRAPPPLPG